MNVKKMLKGVEGLSRIMFPTRANTWLPVMAHTYSPDTGDSEAGLHNTTVLIN